MAAQPDSTETPLQAFAAARSAREACNPEDSDRLTWLLSLEGRKAFYWAVENGEPLTREDIDRKRGA